jgi:hypothetical protein
MLEPPTPARELPAWTHVPSQPLIRSPLSQFQTSADISQRRRFFQVWRFRESPRSPTIQSTSGRQTIMEARPFGPSTVDLPHWLCSSRQLLRESCRRGRMYRSGPGCDHCFRSSKPRRTSRNAVDFFGSGGFASRLAYRPISLVQAGNGLLKPTLFDRRVWICHIGYALAANSCERVAGVDACTVAALDAITAFAVPNLGGHLATPSIFSGLAVRRVD